MARLTFPVPGSELFDRRSATSCLHEFVSARAPQTSVGAGKESREILGMLVAHIEEHQAGGFIVLDRLVLCLTAGRDVSDNLFSGGFQVLVLGHGASRSMLRRLDKPGEFGTEE
jgi:hypothetical protein